MGLWTKILNSSISKELSPFDKRAVRLVNRICAYALALGVLSILINLLLKTWFFIAALGLAILFLSITYIFQFNKKYLLAKINLILVIVGLLLFMSLKGGYGSGLEYYFLALIALPFFLFSGKAWIYGFQFLFLACLTIQKFYSAPVDSNSIPHQVFYVFNSLGSAILIMMAMLNFKNLTVRNEEELYKKAMIIEEKNKQLTEANQQLDFFNHSVSHDLKAPLRAIEGYGHILSEQASKMSPEQVELLNSIQRNTGRMRTLIDNLLAYALTSKKQVELSEINMNKILEEVLQNYRAEIERKKIRVLKTEWPDAVADKELIKHVIDNLVSNAIKYSSKKDQPEIEMGSYEDDPGTVYFVKDNGAGFDMKFAGKLFAPFQRLHSNAEFEGNGVGLSIVKNIILRHGGEVWAEGKPGEGATFYFSLPGVPANTN